ncbi:hypothetical protein [Sinisalibacter aestuarii]|uniref:Uncharacterized protein n=1 Tax=Sinisalibacter aestuarii TaxID=2949426 RepID=A0ABQ5LP29_9RHOB|nr:hypothetical protein [Sinisalibacter aestuarii]GKY86759.1 hypothetical protein STA1M1_06280 [Sinisalibacter aestuarii]
MGTQKKPQKSQSEKFKEAARELGTNDDEAKFDAALKKLAKPKPKEGERGE